MNKSRRLTRSLEQVLKPVARPSRQLAVAIMVTLVAFGGYIAVQGSHAAIPLVGDINNDGVVNVFDLSILLSDWGTSNGAADLNQDGTVNIFDLSMLLSNWGKTATVAPTPSDTVTPLPSASPAYNCTETTAQGQCNYAAVPNITGANSDPWVGQNIWNGGNGYTQTLYAASPSSWYVTANANTNFGGVLTYPNTGWFMTGAIDSLPSTTSSWDVTIPTNTHTAGWAAYDLWFNNWADEVMIQTDLTVNSDYDCTGVATITVNGMPWHMCDFGSERVWKPGTDDQHLINQTAGSVDVKAFLIWMEQNGKLPTGSTWTAGSFGFEICDTGGVAENWQVNNLTWHSP